ncbi:MAG: hypothetical protein ACOY9Y_02775 [Bacillota bacterium]
MAKKLLIILFSFGLLIFSPSLPAQEESQGAQPAESSPKQEVRPLTNNRDLQWEKLGEMQMALMIINKQFEYLISRVEEGDNRVQKLTETYETRLKKEVERAGDQVQNFETKLAEKEMALQQAREKIAQLERDISIFNSEYGVHMRTLIGFLAGILFGLVLASFLQWWKNKGQKKAPAV